MSSDLDLSQFVVTGDDGYAKLEHCADPSAEHGCHVMFVEAGDTLSRMVAAARQHTCEPGS